MTFTQFFNKFQVWLHLDSFRLVMASFAIIVTVALIVLIVIIAKMSKRIKKQETELAKLAVKAETPATEPIAKVEEAAVTETVEEVVAEEVVEEQAAPAAEEAVAEEEAPAANIVINDIADDSDDLAVAKRVPFKDKILESEDKIRYYYTEIENAFRAYRKINPRVSIKCLSFRFGRDLIAKLTIRGKTLKLHLALSVNDFDQNVYFQKDMSDVREYVEVPFAVKIRSDRALKNALALIDALAQKHGIEKKARYTKVDSIALLSEME